MSFVEFSINLKLRLIDLRKYLKKTYQAEAMFFHFFTPQPTQTVDNHAQIEDALNISETNGFNLEEIC